MLTDLADYQAAVAATGQERPSRFDVMMQLTAREGESTKDFIGRIVRVLALHFEPAPALPPEVKF